MAWSPVPPLEAFAESLSVPAMVHAPDVGDVRVLVLGNFALPVAKLALRYPSTVEVLAMVDDLQLPRDKRITRIKGIADIPKDFKANIIAIAMPGDPSSLLKSLRPYTSPDTITVVALDQMGRGRDVLQQLKPIWPHILPYIAHVPEPALFFLLSDRKIQRPVRNFPPNLKKLTPGYMASLFVLAKDERKLLYDTGDPS